MVLSTLSIVSDHAASQSQTTLTFHFSDMPSSHHPGKLKPPTSWRVGMLGPRPIFAMKKGPEDGKALALETCDWPVARPSGSTKVTKKSPEAFSES